MNCWKQEAKDNEVQYRLRLPCRGDFFLIIFAHLEGENIPASENVFKAVCEYKIIAGSDVPSRVDPFPSCSDLTWGPDTFVSTYGLTPTKKEALLRAPGGRADVAFDKSRPNIRVYARLVKDGVPDSELRNAVGVKNDNDKVPVYPMIILPECSSLLWLPYAVGQAIIFLPCGFFLLSFYLFSSPNPSGHRLDVYHTSTHGVALVRI